MRTLLTVNESEAKWLKENKKDWIESVTKDGKKFDVLFNERVDDTFIFNWGIQYSQYNRNRNEDKNS